MPSPEPRASFQRVRVPGCQVLPRVRDQARAGCHAGLPWLPRGRAIPPHLQCERAVLHCVPADAPADHRPARAARRGHPRGLLRLHLQLALCAATHTAHHGRSPTALTRPLAPRTAVGGEFWTIRSDYDSGNL
eukprot:4447151-Prymnesium_polylepis.1